MAEWQWASKHLDLQRFALHFGRTTKSSKCSDTKYCHSYWKKLYISKWAKVVNGFFRMDPFDVKNLKKIYKIFLIYSVPNVSIHTQIFSNKPKVWLKWLQYVDHQQGLTSYCYKGASQDSPCPSPLVNNVMSGLSASRKTSTKTFLKYPEKNP